MYLKPPLRRARGDNVSAECSFHADRTPSFSFNRRTGLWRCFGCGASGSAA
ncbi:MAG TPA: CHC2 zinc finger domain-containing protein, partial [Gemmatimonadales bacterium]|nr:CHC2 zinc finger domain-containing protein [Gemmatimonadales bacterium]